MGYGYAGPMDHLMHPLAAVNGCWALSYVWIDGAMIADLVLAAIHRKNPFATSAVAPVDAELPFAHQENSCATPPVVSDASCPPHTSLDSSNGGHPFGLPSAASDALFWDLPAEEQELLLSAVFPSGNGVNFGETPNDIGAQATGYYTNSPMDFSPSSTAIGFGFIPDVSTPAPSNAIGFSPPALNPVQQPFSSNSGLSDFGALTSGAVQTTSDTYMGTDEAPGSATPLPFDCDSRAEYQVPILPEDPRMGAPLVTSHISGPMQTPQPVAAQVHSPISVGTSLLARQEWLSAPVTRSNTSFRVPATQLRISGSATPAARTSFHQPRRPSSPATQIRTAPASRAVTPQTRLGPNLRTGYRPPATPPAGVRKPSRPPSDRSAPSTPSPHPLRPQTQLRAAHSLPPRSRLRTPFLPHSSLVTDLIAPPRSPIPGTPRVRTPPPLARTPDQAPIAAEVAADDSGFLGDEDEPDGKEQVLGLHQDPVPMPRLRKKYSAPTIAEYKERRITELCDIQAGKKYEPNAQYPRTKGAKKIGEYSKEAQGVMAVMRLSVRHSYVSRGPFWEDEGVLIERAKGLANEITECDLDQMVDKEFKKTLKLSLSQLRSTGQDPIKAMVQTYFKVSEGDVDSISWLQEHDRCVYGEYSLELEDFLNFELVPRVVGVLYFGSGRKLAMVYLDKLLVNDDPEELEELLTVATPSSEPETIQIVDRSPDALRGPSLAAIAFAGIHIVHALERLKYPNRDKRKKHEDGVRKKEFDEGYDERWGYYVCQLAKSPNLGELRSKCLKHIQ
ncbi:hypothetical protein FS749_000212 [Ceratobasidium sp. UAMH 11750]|nr:hypothetical protein FS749_000212 [Ceratobasidium sp. UAMH 11750]